MVVVRRWPFLAYLQAQITGCCVEAKLFYRVSQVFFHYDILLKHNANKNVLVLTSPTLRLTNQMYY